eukprot:364721-Chlamydomonas_euryale.AAC.3
MPQSSDTGVHGQVVHRDLPVAAEHAEGRHDGRATGRDSPESTARPRPARNRQLRGIAQRPLGAGRAPRAPCLGTACVRTRPHHHTSHTDRTGFDRVAHLTHSDDVGARSRHRGNPVVAAAASACCACVLDVHASRAQEARARRPA